MRELLQDIKLGARTLLKQRGFAAVVILTLAVAIGGNIAIFSLIQGVLLQPLPYPEADRIVRLHETRRGSNAAITALTYLDWQSGNQVFDRMAAHANGPVTLTGVTEPVQLRSAQVAADYFEIFGIRAALGRTFLPDEDEPGHTPVAVISDSLWRTQFGAAPSIIGRSILIDDQPHLVIGVLPSGTAIDRGDQQLWRPLVFTEQNRTRNYHWLSVVARLKPGVTLEQARANMNTIAGRIAAAYPETNKEWGVRIEPFRDGVVSGPLRRSLGLLMIAVAVVLAIACANVASLGLTRGLAREREVAIRLSLGASRARLIRQFATEGGLLCAAGSGLGLALGNIIKIGINAALPPGSLPGVREISISAPVVLFTLGLMIATTLVCALLPAARTTRPELAGAIYERTMRAPGGAVQSRLNGIFVVVQVALAFALLAAAGLLVRSVARLQRVDAGIDPSNLLTVRLPIAAKRFSNADAFSAYLRELAERVGAAPGVRNVAFALSLPLQRGGYGMGVQIVGEPEVDVANRPFTFFKPVSPSYFRALRMQIRRGRPLSPRDTSSAAPVVIINDAFARKYFPNRNALGQRVLIREVLFGKLGLGSDVAWEIVGIVSDERVGGLENEEPTPIVYASNEQSPQMISQILIVRGTLAPLPLEREVRAAIRGLSPDQVLADVKTIEQIRADSLGPRRFQSGLLVAFAAVALVLAALGIYGLLSYTVAQRTRELGIRSALGANARQLIRHVVARGMKLVGLGLALGVLIALAAGQLMSGFLFGITERDPVSFAAGIALLAMAAWIACYLPARRASMVDPIICLRSE